LFPFLSVPGYSLSVVPNGYARAFSSNSLNIYGQAPFTVEAWIKPPSSSAGVSQAIVSHFKNASSTEGGYLLRLIPGKKLRFVVYRSTSLPDSSSVDSDILFPFDNQWHHVAAVYDPGAAGNELRLYIDGQPHGVAPCYPGPGSRIDNLYIGITNDPANVQYFTGLIDEMRITAAALYNGSFTPSPHPDVAAGTMALWHFDDGPGFKYALDATSFGNTGYFKGSPLPTFSTDIPSGAPGNQPPVANAGGPYSGTAGAAVQFNGTGSFDPDGSITSYQWNFGDSTSGSGSLPTHAYAAAGVYTVSLTVTENAGATASASTSANIGSGGAGATATFVRTDTTTQGSWKTRYGSNGFEVVNDSVSYPTYATVSATGQSLFTWVASTSDWRALQKSASATDRIAATMYSNGTFTINVNLTDGQSHQLALYCLDWDLQDGRQQRIDMRDAATNTLLDSRTVTSYTQGKYLIWTLRGNLKIELTTLAGYNAVISGLFFDPPNTPPPAPPRGAFNGPHSIPGLTQAEDFDNGAEGVAYHDTTPGNDWGANSYRNTGVDVVLSSDGGSAYVIGNGYAGEWIEYTVNAASAQNYDFQARVASGGPGGVFHYEVDGVSKGSVSVPDTGSWGTFVTLTTPNVALTAGQHILRVSLDANGTQQYPAIADFNYFNFVSSSSGAPAAPSNLTATAVSSSQINLAWQDNSNNETGFKIERSLDGVNFSLLTTVGMNTTAYQNTGLTLSTTYYYRVKASNANGDSAPSNVAVATTPGGSPIDFLLARTLPANRTGSPGEDLFSGNYNWGLPLVGLQGRSSMDLALSLTYNSLVWTRSGSSIKFDADNGFPAPGFRIGFPIIQPRGTGNGGVRAYLLVSSTGARVELRETTPGIFEAMDSSFLQLIESSMTLRGPDGSMMTYQQVAGGNFVCLSVKDRNGNFMTATYAGDRITTITDTVGRVITFNYQSNNLATITQTWNGAAHTWAQFTYQTVSISPNFPGLSVIAPGSISALVSLRLADNSSYTFDYTSLGQVSAFHHLAPDGHQVAYVAYTTDNSTTDCPRLTARQDFAENWNNNSAVFTSFHVDPLGTGVGTATLPDATSVEETYPISGFNRGLSTQSRIISGGIARKTTTRTWTQNDTSLSYQANPRLIDTTTSDDAGNLRRTSLAYTSFNLVNDVIEYAAGGPTVLRHKQTDYLLDAVYVDRRIIGLPREQRLYDGAGTANLVSKVTYDYDWGLPFLQNQGAPVQHDSTNYSDTFVQGRGNVSAVNRFDVSTGQSTQVQMTGYNTTGSPIFVRDAIRNVLTISYADSYSAGTPPGLTLAYPTTILDGENFTTTAMYHYDLGVTTKTHDPKGAEMLMEYNDAAGRLTRQTYFDGLNLVSGTYTRLEYAANGVEGRAYTLLDPGVEAFSAVVTDGAGRTAGMVRNLPGSAGGYSAQKFVYDVLGRLRQQSNPTEIAYTLGQAVTSWTPTGDDAGSWKFSTQDYDWQGRPTTTYNTDGTSRSATYGGCGCAGGEVATFIDEVGRHRINTSDILGRLYKTQELRDDGTIYRTVTNTFNARDQIVSVFVNRGNSGPGQTTTVTYDGHARLKTRKTPIETSPTTYDYNVDDTVQVVTDPRGATATYAYNNRRLVTGITYGVPSGSGIPGTPPVTFSYDQNGNVSQMTDGTGQISFDYDTWSRLIRETRFFNEVAGGSTPFALVYAYNLAGQLKRVVDPFNAQIDYGYDQAGRLSSVTGTPFGNAGVTQYATDLRYRAWGGLKHLNYGNNPLQLNLTYNARLQVDTMQVGGIQSVPDLINKQYAYYQDGRLNYSRDQVNSFYSRGYQYDHVGRLSQGLSGSTAPQGVSNGPYTQTFSHDFWDNLTARQTGDSRSFAFNYDSATNRNGSWLYDAAGNVTRDEHAPFNRFTFDAAGRQVTQTGPTAKSWTYDGSGRVAKWVLNNATTFDVWSSVLGYVLTELDASGNKQRTYVYAGRQLLAKQQRNKVFWHHVDASNASSRDSNVGGAMVRSNEIDPLGAPADQTDLPDPDPDIPEPIANFNNLSTGCLLDGIDTPCSIVLRVLESGAGAIAPWNTTRWNSNTNKFEFFKAYADGTSGWSPMGAANNGAGYKPPTATGAGGSRAYDPFATENLIASVGDPILPADEPPEPAPPGCKWIKSGSGWALDCGHSDTVNVSANSKARVIDVEQQTALLIKYLKELNERGFPTKRERKLQRKLENRFINGEVAQTISDQKGFDDCVSGKAWDRAATDIGSGVSILGGIVLLVQPTPFGKPLGWGGVVGGGIALARAKPNFDAAVADCKKQFPRAMEKFSWNPFAW
jgi:YD repeat-containing protein